jgi:HlyD family secretion protein
VTLDAFPGKTFKTTVVHINPAAQPTATGGTIFQVELALTDTGKTILLGMKGDATIQVSAVASALTIPVEALFNQNGQNYVFKLQGTTLKQTNITVGATTDTSVEVLSGLADGDTVALAGATTYTDGMTVRTK